ncbi:CHAT domain-containing protein [Streptomyces sp. NPDC002886]|uniref:CHAT domain-containing protein n=1 Tax=Streptomyces sp. NPDC002886 TaxID=3364667 RepID=UPI00369E66A8
MHGGPFYDLLPAEHLAQDVLPALSFDAQVYFFCEGCGMFLRSNPLHGAVPDALHRPPRCPSCGTAVLEQRLFVYRIRLSCDDCGHGFGALTTRFFFTPVCPECGSERCTQTSAEPHTDLPQAVLDLKDARAGESRAWGLDAAADEAELSRELRVLLSAPANPDAIRYLVPAALFAGRLATWNHYRSQTWRLRNLEGILLHQFHRRTGVVHAGLHAFGTLAALAEGADAPEDPVSRGMVSYNAAAAGFTLLNNVHGAVLSEDPEEIRSRSLSLAEDARASFEADSSLDPEVRSVEIARINYLLGDITRKPTAGPDRLRKAVRHFDAALAEPAIPAPLRTDIADSRANTLEDLHRLDPGGTAPVRREIDYSGPDWAALPVLDRCIWLHRAANQLEVDGDDAAAEEALRRAADLAATELRTTPDALLVPAVRHYHRYFDELARVNIRLGRPLVALEAVEEARALIVLRQTTPAEQARKELAKASFTKLLTNLLTTPPDAPRFSAFRAPRRPERRPRPLTDAALRGLTDSGWPADTAICSYVFASGTVSVVIAVPAGDGWRVEGAQWPVNVDVLLESSAVSEMAHAARFRRRRMAAYCAKASPVLLKGLVPLLRDSGVRRVAISAPGVFSQIPFEGLEVDGVPFGEEFEVFLTPSLRSAAALARRSTPGTGPGRVFVANYRGADLPESSAESEQIMTVWGDRADLLDPGVQRKAELLDSISADPYELLHFACHGSFDPASETRSALHFGAPPGGRPLVLEARELAGRALPRSPVVVLSACQSALTSWSLSGDCIGLTGALLRMGARGVVGSRWAVFDDSARVFMDHLHTEISRGASPQRAVTLTQRRMRATHAIDDWAAFSYLGLPDLTKTNRPTKGPSRR